MSLTKEMFRRVFSFKKTLFSCSFSTLGTFQLDYSGRSIELQRFQWEHLQRTITSNLSSRYEEYLDCFPNDKRIYGPYRRYVLQRREAGQFLMFLKYFPNDVTIIAAYKNHVLESGLKRVCVTFLENIPGDDPDVVALYRALVMREDSRIFYIQYCQKYPEDDKVAASWRQLVLRNSDAAMGEEKLCIEFLEVYPQDEAVLLKLNELSHRD